MEATISVMRKLWRIPCKPTINYIKMSPKGMEVRKKGVVNVHMVFEQGKKNMTYYSTPYGTIEMGIAATIFSWRKRTEA